jgi:hypothetical protein
LIARLRTGAGVSIATTEDFVEIFGDAEPQPVSKPVVNKDDFLRNPNRYYFAADIDVAPKWIGEAWDTDRVFRENITSQIAGRE